MNGMGIWEVLKAELSEGMREKEENGRILWPEAYCREIKRAVGWSFPLCRMRIRIGKSII